MALYSLNASAIGKTTHESGTASAHLGYICRTKACREVIAANLPVPSLGTRATRTRKWLRDEEDADRKNARVIDKIMVALPVELDGQERVELVKEFIKRIGAQDVPWLAAIHDTAADANNPHAHLVIRDRHKETGKRVLELGKRDVLRNMRETWADVTNDALREAGHEVRVDHRTLEKQGIDREPQKHIGPVAKAIDADERDSWKLEATREKERAQEDAREAKVAREKANEDAKRKATKAREKAEEIRDEYVDTPDEAEDEYVITPEDPAHKAAVVAADAALVAYIKANKAARVEAKKVVDALNRAADAWDKVADAQPADFNAAKIAADIAQKAADAKLKDFHDALDTADAKLTAADAAQKALKAADAADACDKVVENAALEVAAARETANHATQAFDKATSAYYNQGQAYPLTQDHENALKDAKDAAGKWKRASANYSDAADAWLNVATTIAQAWRTAADKAAEILAKMVQAPVAPAADRQAWLKEAAKAADAAKALETDPAFSEAQTDANALKTDFQACQGIVDSHEKYAREKAVEAEKAKAAQTTADTWENVVENAALEAPAARETANHAAQAFDKATSAYDNQGKAYPLTQDHVNALKDAKDAAGKWKYVVEKVVDAADAWLNVATTIAQAWRTAADKAAEILAKMVQTPGAPEQQAWQEETDKAVQSAEALETYLDFKTVQTALHDAQTAEKAHENGADALETAFQACQGIVDLHEKEARASWAKKVRAKDKMVRAKANNNAQIVQNLYEGEIEARDYADEWGAWRDKYLKGDALLDAAWTVDEAHQNVVQAWETAKKAVQSAVDSEQTIVRAWQALVGIFANMVNAQAAEQPALQEEADNTVEAIMKARTEFVAPASAANTALTAVQAAKTGLTEAEDTWEKSGPQVRQDMAIAAKSGVLDVGAHYNHYNFAPRTRDGIANDSLENAGLNYGDLAAKSPAKQTEAEQELDQDRDYDTPSLGM